MASSGTNVLRYTALFSGVAYGVYHQSVITARSKAHHVDAEFKHQEGLMQKAKAEWAKKTAPPVSGVITDPNDSKFDLEALMMKAADSPNELL